jgi:hypothetical protein
MSVASVDRSSFVVHTYTQKNSENNIKIKKGHIWFNGCKIKIGNSLKETARNINKLYKSTGIKAHIIKDKRGHEKLTLKVSGNILNINDPQGLLAELYKKGKIGKNKDSTIQVIRRLGGKGEVQINYNKSFPKKESSKLDKLKLSEQNITYLAGYKLNVNKNIEKTIAQLVANSAVFEQIKKEDEYNIDEVQENINIEPIKAVLEHNAEYECSEKSIVSEEDLDDSDMNLSLSSFNISPEAKDLFMAKPTQNILITQQKMNMLQQGYLGMNQLTSLNKNTIDLPSSNLPQHNKSKIPIPSVNKLNFFGRKESSNSLYSEDYKNQAKENINTQNTTTNYQKPLTPRGVRADINRSTLKNNLSLAIKELEEKKQTAIIKTKIGARIDKLKEEQKNISSLSKEEIDTKLALSVEDWKKIKIS